MSISVSIPKFTDKGENEDACFSSTNCIAVSDGAGGCGMFANEWSRYLIDKLPKDKPLLSFEEFDAWVGDIWEDFFNEHENLAKQGDAMLLERFYKEGSYATIAAVWRVGDDACQWVSYGDSVVFHYNSKTDELEHSFSKLADFTNAPRLVSCKDELEKEGFKSGSFHTDGFSYVFVASDALSHYILMMYELSHCNKYGKELEEVQQKQTSNSNLLLTATAKQEKATIHFEDIIRELEKACSSEDDFREYLQALYSEGVIDTDDFSLAFLDQKMSEEKQTPEQITPIAKEKVRLNKTNKKDNNGSKSSGGKTKRNGKTKKK